MNKLINTIVIDEQSNESPRLPQKKKKKISTKMKSVGLRSSKSGSKKAPMTRISGIQSGSYDATAGNSALEHQTFGLVGNKMRLSQV